MMDGRFSADLTGAMAVISGAGQPLPEAPFIRTPGLLARPSETVFAPRSLRDLVAAGQPPSDDAVAGAEVSEVASETEAMVPQKEAMVPQPVMRQVAPVAAAPAPALPLALAEARAQARREALAEVAEERAALGVTARSLAAALDRIAHPPAEDLARLTDHLGQAVATLAAERAGVAIDADAAPFARRIADLAARVTESFAQVTLRLHPADHTALLALLQGEVPADLADLARARIVPDAALNRGDVALRAPGLRLEDRIAAAEPMPQGEVDDVHA